MSILSARKARAVVRMSFLEMATKKTEEKQMTETKKTNKKVILGVGILVVLVAALAMVYAAFGAKPVAGSKAITIEVVNKAQESTIYEVDGVHILGINVQFVREYDTNPDVEVKFKKSPIKIIAIAPSPADNV